MKYLIIIDPQNDFVEGGALGIRGAKEALENIIPLLDRKWEKIIVSLDSHNPTHMGFKLPKTELLTMIRKDHLGKLDKWPKHCVKDTPGWEIYEPLWKKLRKLGNVEYVMKGENDLEEDYSAWKYLPLGKDDKPELHFAGLAMDYCVLETIKEGVKNRPEADFILHVKATAPVGTYEHAQELYSELKINYESGN